MGSGVVIREEVGSSTGNVSRSTSGTWTAAGVVIGDGKTNGGEEIVDAHIDARQIPEDGVTRQSILVLQGIRDVRSARHLNGDTTSIGIQTPLLRVGAAGGNGNHLGRDV